MAFGLITILHIVAILFAIIELGLTAYAVSVFYNRWGPYVVSRSPDSLNFMVFNSVWSLLVLAYLGLTPIYAARLFHKLVALGLLALTTIFWFAGSIALAAYLGGPWNCGRDTLCGSTSAAVAFGFFLWAIFTVLLVLEGLEWNRNRNSVTSDPHKPHASTTPYNGA
ncbi:hypothetical protein PspLS_05222 [Pyricularia sp. CBS 133598]|nr:hypothetical protein PspLS_05222 [Pyricularia sp. CBS 133598]